MRKFLTVAGCIAGGSAITVLGIVAAIETVMLTCVMADEMDEACKDVAYDVDEMHETLTVNEMYEIAMQKAKQKSVEKLIKGAKYLGIL